ncbi:hypothetical protein [Brevundimonas lenta]|uniref:Uncharacterized protein n=1 Tax=Brevundimonas lenta TaxID=424796 RepID=A0A7W6JBN8_9CAUL|nr:hypothetical protein [Brevundimonas lenta]MBB4082124.1 hypothetical protein [Brevundimonas lenta]
MAGLSVAHRAALAALLGRCSETVVRTVATTIASMPGGRAAELRMILADEMRDRARRAMVLAPVVPMFRPRTDGIAALTFPAPVLARLWKAAIEREPHLLPRLDKDGPDVVAVANRICHAAAAAVRDRPEVVWPPDLAPGQREQGLSDLAACLDLAHLARSGLPSIEIWLKRPDGDQLAELRLLVKDCAAIHSDGARRVLEMLFAHLQDAVLVLRIITRTSGVAEREGFLSASELADFVDRLLAGVDERAARLAAYKPGAEPGGVQAVVADLDWCCSVLAELDVTLTLDPNSHWGKSVRDARVSVAAWLSGLLRAADKAVDKALPLTRVQTAGRMSRKAPLMSAPARGELAEAAFSLLQLVGAARGMSGTFGCEAERKTLVDGLTERLSEYADQVLVMINDGEVDDEDHALKLVSVAARYLELLDARDAARTVRRRAAVAGGPAAADGASSRAA